MRYRLKLLFPLVFWTTLAWSVAIFLVIYLIADTPFDFGHYFNSLAAGFLAALGSAGVGWIMNRLAPRLPTWQTVTVRTFLFVLLIVGLSFLSVALRALLLQAGPDVMENMDLALRKFFITREFLITLIFLIPTSFGVQFFLQLQRLLGPGNLWRFVVGTYQKPIEEDRIFVFIDLNHSTSLTESLGPMRFAEFKNDFFHGLTRPVLDTEAEIVDYVGDEAILSWKTPVGLHNANWVRCLFLFDDWIRKRAGYYREHYGVEASFKASAHEGRVLASEMGNIRRKIAYSGDCLNTAARMEALCAQTGCQFLVSDHLIKMTDIPAEYPFRDLGSFALRGKSDQLGLWGA